MPIANPRIAGHTFLAKMYADAHFPGHLVDQGQAILRDLAERIEAAPPADLAALYVLSNAAIEQFNQLSIAFAAAGGEIETVARERICEEFAFIAAAYGFGDADVEELTAERDW